VATRHIVVVGSSIAGVAAADAVRAAGFEGIVTLVGAEKHVPYDRPPLSKQLLDGRKSITDIALRPEGHYAERSVELRLGQAAVSLDPTVREVVLADGSHLRYDGCIVATGARARLPWPRPHAAGLHVLRSQDDACALQRDLERRPRVVVVGAGFIGLEVAASARTLGCAVTVVEMATTPLAGALPQEIGQRIVQLHEMEGVRVRCGAGVRSVKVGPAGVEGVLLTNGMTVPADVVVVGAGVVPEVEWLRSSGLSMDDGIACDRFCATDAPGVYAAGDVARWHNELFDERIRVEHWTNAVEQGRAAGMNLVADLDGRRDERMPFAPVPYFWSDQYGAKLQFAGRARPDDDLVELNDGPRGFVAIFTRGARLRGVFGINAPRQVALGRRLVAQGCDVEDAVAVLGGAQQLRGA
jgi:NADPH-dependent 2,4-dienoyl-CoA reductase/sulfur reductase-like enzyme